MQYESIGHRVLKFSVDETHHGSSQKSWLDTTYHLGCPAARGAYLVKILYEAFQELAAVSGVSDHIKFESPKVDVARNALMEARWEHGYLQVIKV